MEKTNLIFKNKKLSFRKQFSFLKNYKIYIVFILYIIIIFIFILSKLKKILFSSLKNANNLQKKLNFSIEFNKIYSDLYFEAKSGKSLKPEICISYKNENYLTNKKNGICLCTMAKNENLYVREFIEYYRVLGFNKIIIFDNNDIDGEKLDPIIGDYIKNNSVEIIDIRGLFSTQISVYNYFYKRYSHFFDWIAFFDIDEYLYIKNNLNINNYLYNLRFKNCESIIFNSHIYNDNNLEKYDNRTLIERFKSLKLISKLAKSIVRGGLKNIIFFSVHVCAKNINYFCDSTGKRIFPTSYIEIKKSKDYMAYIKHFYTKTAEEMCIKINRGDAQFSREKTFIKRLKKFFSINKIKILENCSHINQTKFINTKIIKNSI